MPAEAGLSGGQGGPEDELVRLTAWVGGLVQGVGFRWWVRAQARRLRLTGTVTNLADGRVLVVAEGTRPTCHELLALIGGPGAPGRVTGVSPQWGRARGEFSAFTAL